MILFQILFSCPHWNLLSVIHLGINYLKNITVLNNTLTVMVIVCDFSFFILPLLLNVLCVVYHQIHNIHQIYVDYFNVY